MSGEYRRQLPPSVVPTPQEQQLLDLESGNFERVAQTVAEDVQRGQSPSILSVVRPDLLFDFAETWLGSAPPELPVAIQGGYKSEYFDRLAGMAEGGEAAEIVAFPKFATSLGQISLALEVVLSNRDIVTGWQAERHYLQYLGTFDPQHIGHRIGVQSALLAAGGRSSVIATTMGSHPFKTGFNRPYVDRFTAAEQRFYESPLIDNTRLTTLDVPGALGLGAANYEQMQLLADLAGDSQMRWTIGSDKFLLDANAIRAGEAVPRARARFANSALHPYVIHRQSDDFTELENSIDYITDTFSTEVTLVEELPYDCAPASSSKIKQLRAEGRNVEADHMEYYELTP